MAQASTWPSGTSVCSSAARRWRGVRALLLACPRRAVRALARHLPPRAAPDHPAFQYGVPHAGETVRLFENFACEFDTRTRNPKWVIERINRETSQGGSGDRSNSAFFEDDGIDEAFRSASDPKTRPPRHTAADVTAPTLGSAGAS